jgi:hypothetical protein
MPTETGKDMVVVIGRKVRGGGRGLGKEQGVSLRQVHHDCNMIRTLEGSPERVTASPRLPPGRFATVSPLTRSSRPCAPSTAAKSCDACWCGAEGSGAPSCRQRIEQGGVGV